MPSHRTRRTPVVTAAVALGVLASATAVYAVGLEPDGTHLRASFPTGGEAWLELEDRNVEPAICFVWESDGPQDGDSIASRVLTRTGAPVLDLGIGDQWVEGGGRACEIARDERYRDVFANPGAYVVEFRVVEEQGTPATAPVRSGPLRTADS